MVDEHEPESDGPIEEEGTQSVPPRSSNRVMLFVVLGLIAAIGGYYSAFRRPAAAVPSAAEDGLSPLTNSPFPGGAPGAGTPPNPAGGPAPGPAPPGPLEFLREGLAERPTEVDKLVAEVKQVCDRLVEGFPEQSDAWEITGRLYFRLGDSEAATKAWKRCIELNPEYGYAYHGLAQLAAKTGDNQEAARLFRLALTHNPDSFETQIELASALIDANQLEDAVSVLMDNIVSDPRRYRGRVLLGMAHMQMGDYKKAKKDYEAAIEDHPAHANAHFGLFNACTRLGEKELAKEYMVKYQELRAAERELAEKERREFDDLETMCIDVAGTYFEAATVCFSHGHLSEAELLLVRAGVLNPQDVKCRQSLAFMYLQINQPVETVRVLTELSEIEPQNTGYPIEISRLLVAVGNLLAAEQNLRQAADRLPPDQLVQVARATTQRPDRNATHFVVLSIACEVSGDAAGATTAMGKAVELAPDNVVWKQRHEMLSEKEPG